MTSELIKNLCNHVCALLSVYLIATEKHFSNLTLFELLFTLAFTTRAIPSLEEVGQLRWVQDEIGSASYLPMADAQRTRFVAKQQLLAGQQSRVEVCGDGKRGSPQMVDAVRNVIQQIPTRRAECGTTHRRSLGYGTGEQAYIDRAPKGGRSSDQAQQKYVYINWPLILFNARL
jgi:hypothetical protein